MTNKNTKDKQKCSSKQKIMFAYGIIQLGSGVISALALTAIALNLSSVTIESKVFNECVEELQARGKDSSSAVRFLKWR